MGFGDFDQQEYERRERSSTELDSGADDQPDSYRGEVRLVGDASTATLLKRLRKNDTDDDSDAED